MIKSKEERSFISAISKDGKNFIFHEDMYDGLKDDYFEVAEQSGFRYIQVLNTDTLQYQVDSTSEFRKYRHIFGYMSDNPTVGIRYNGDTLSLAFLTSLISCYMDDIGIKAAFNNKRLFTIEYWEDYSVIANEVALDYKIIGTFWKSPDLFIIRCKLAVCSVSFKTGKHSILHGVCTFDILCDRDLEMRGIYVYNMPEMMHFVSDHKLIKNSFVARYALTMEEQGL